MDWKEIYKQKQNGTYTPTATTTPSTTGATVPSAGGGDWRSIYEQKQNAKGTDVNSWTSAVNTLISDYNTSSSMWEEEGEGFSSYLSERERLLSYADNFRSQYSGNQEALEYIDEVVGVLDSLPVKLLKTWDDVWRDKYQGKSFNEINVLLRELEDGREKDWLTQYANSPEVMTAKDYENALSIAENQLEWYQERNKPTVDTVVYGKEITELEDEIERLRAGQWQRQNMDKYGNLQENADFGRVSSMVPTEKTAGFGLGFGAAGNFWWLGKGDPVYDYINDIDGAREESVDRRMSGANNPFYIYDHMTENEISSYNYIYHTQGEKEAKEYLDYLKYELDERQTQQAAANAEWFADEHPVAASAISVPVNLMSGVGLIDVAGQNIARSISGEYKPINYNTGAMGASTVSSTIRGTVAQNIVDSTGVIEIDSEEHPILSRVLNGKSWADVYQLGMSMADSLAIRTMAPVFGKAGTLLLGGAAGTQGMLDALERGANDEQALFMGVLNGTFEALFEKYSLEKLMAGGKGNILKSMLMQGIFEGSEEVNTSIANNIADIIIMAGNSDYEKNVAAYIDSGLSPEKARKKAFWDKAIEIGWDFVGGMASGSLMGGGEYLSNHITSYRGDSEALLNTAKNSSNEELMKLAEEMAGKRMTIARANKLLEGMTSADVQTIAKAAGEQLKALGEEGDIDLLSTAIAKTAVNTAEKQNKVEMSQHISRAEEIALKKSKYGQQVLNELNAENILNGKVGGDWTGSLNTMRINPELYGRDKTIAKINEALEQNAKKADITVPKLEAEDVKPTGNDTVDAIINKAHGKELSGNDVRPILESAEAIKALETVVGSLDLKGKSPSEQRHIVREAVTEYAAAHPVAIAGSKAVPSSVEAVASKYGKQAGAVRSIYNISPVENVDSFAAAFEAAYNIGLEGGYESAALESSVTQVMSETQRRLAYETGKAVRAAKMLEGTKRSGKGGGVVRARGMKAEDINKRFKRGSNQKTALQVLRTIAEVTGFTIEVFDSEGDYSMEQGSFDWGTDIVAIDIASGICKAEDVEQFAKYAMLRTFCHEFTHAGEKWAAEEYNILRTAVIEALSTREDFNLDERIADIQRFDYEAKKAQYIAEGMEETAAAEKAEAEKLSWDMASREVVAEAMTDVLPESRFIQSLYEKSPSLAKRLGDALRRFLARITGYYKDLVSNPSAEAQALKVEIGGAVKYLEGIVDKWDAMALAAVERYQNAAVDNVSSAEVSVAKVTGSGDGAVEKSTFTDRIVSDAQKQLQVRTEEEAYPKMIMSPTGGAPILVTADMLPGLASSPVKGLINGKEVDGFTGRQIRNYVMKQSGFSVAQRKNLNDFMGEMSKFMKEAGVTYKFIGLQDVENAKLHYNYNPDGSIKSIILSAMVKNGDYPVNFDLTSICKKRVAMSSLITKLCARGSIDSGIVDLTPQNIFKINTALKNAGYETACLGCFVESKRYNVQEWAVKFCKKWNEAVKKVNPNATYFGYGKGETAEVSVDRAIKLDAAANQYIATSKGKRLESALKKYEAKEANGEPLIEGKTVKVFGEEIHNTFNKATRERLEKSYTLSEELKQKYLNCDVTTLTMEDVSLLLEHGILPGAAVSNKMAVTNLVNSGEEYQHLLRPSDLLTAEGITQLEKLPNFHGVLYGHYGSGTPKLIQGFTPYNSEIALLPAKKGKMDLAEYLYSIAGVRMQSFSDFQIQNIYDYLQMVGDLAARKLPAHAYTKEMPFAKLLGMTGIKTNLSVMFDIDFSVDKAHAGLARYDPKVHTGEYAKIVLEDEQGQWVYNVGDYATQQAYQKAYPDQAKRFLQSIGFADAVKLQTSEGYTANCGIIGVGFSDLGILAMLDDSRIRYVIPYHASSLPDVIKHATNIYLGTDYTSWQNTTKISAITDSAGNKVSWSFKAATKRLGSALAALNELNDHIKNDGWKVETKKAQNGHGSFGLYEDLAETNDPRKTVDNFFEWCASNNTLPMFYQFAGHGNYYKLLYDFNVYDCVTEEYAPHHEVRNIYPTQDANGNIVPGDATEAGFNSEYLRGTINKQMSDMNSYFENLDRDLDTLAGNIEQGRYDLGNEQPTKQYLRRVTDEATLKKLNKAESEGIRDFNSITKSDTKGVVKVYRAMQAQPVDEDGNVIPKAAVQRIVSYEPLVVEAKVFGKNKNDFKIIQAPAKLFSPMAGANNGVWRNSIALNEWEMSEGHLERATTQIDKKTGAPKIDTNKKNASYGEIAYYFGLEKGGVDDNGKPLTDVPARYNPYVHTSLSALNDQFSSGEKRPELVTVESLVPVYHINSGDRLPGAKDRVGAMSWHSGPTSSRLAKVGKARVVILSRYDKPIRVVPDSEVAASIADTIGDSKDIAIQQSTVTPSLAKELRALGISVLNAEEWAKYAEEHPVDSFGKKTTKQHQARNYMLDEDSALALDDIRDIIKKDRGIKWNDGNTLMLPKNEYAAVVSRISTDYYRKKAHGGVQCIDRSTDGRDANHYLYLYIDHGFDNYEIIGRIEYKKQHELALFLREAIQNGRNAERIPAGSNRLRNFYERTAGSGHSHNDRGINTADGWDDTGSRGPRRRNNGQPDTSDSYRHDEDGNGTETAVSQVQKQQRATMTAARIDDLIADSGAGSRTDYAQKWISSINPTDFLNLTLGRANQDRAKFDTMPGDYDSTVNDYDFIEGGLKKSRQTPYLAIDIETGEVVGHEGRHRMRALEKAGVTYAEIAVEFRDSDGRIVKEMNGYGNALEAIASLTIYNQRGTGQSAVINNIIPLNKASRELVLQNYGKANAGDIQYQRRTPAYTDREVLAMAASEVEAQINDLSDGERDALRIFNDRLVKWEELQTKRAELGKQYRELQFGPNVDREAAKATLERMKLMDEQLQRAEAAVLSVEDKAVLKRVLKKARKVVEQQEHERGKEEIARWRDRRNNAEAIKKYRNRIRADVDELSNWILHPNNKNAVKHVPDALKSSVIPFLSSINFMSKRQLAGGNPTVADEAFMKQLNSVKAALKQNIDVNGLYSGYNDLPPDFMESLQRFIDTAQEITKKSSGEFVINRMTSEELKELSKLVRTLKKYIMQVNRFHANAMYQHVYEAGDGSIEFMGELNNAGNTGVVSNFVLWQQMRPAYAFERFGKGGMAIYDGLRRGQSTLAFNTKKITEFAEAAYTAEEVKAWEKEIKTFSLGGDTVKIPVSGIMSLYELSKRPQALGHVLGEGIRVATYKDGKTKISDTGHRLTPGEMNEIINSLTQRQKDVADQLQQFMAKQGGEWGNYVSVKRWGEELFGEEHYFPINSDGRHLQATADEHPSAASLYALLNMSFTKELQEGANNRIILYSIFDVFSNHMASMAQYNAFALPVLDALKWFNYQQTSEPDENGHRTILGSVREQMDRVYGVPEETRPGSGRQGYAQSFVINIIKAFNGTEAQGVPMDELGMNALRKYNMAQVAYNFRVVVQQPLAITRAALLVDYSSIIKGMRLSPAEIRKNISEMQEHSGIAAWKALGFYDINISRGLTSIIKHDTDWRDTVSEIGMKGAETMDTLTWAGIWSACKEQVRKTQKLKPGDEGFFEAVTTLFEDVVYKTQVVDSVLTKNEYLRSKGFFTRATASFMSEPTTTASMLMSAFDKFRMDMQRGMTRQQAWKKNSKYIVRVAYVYGIGAAVLAAVQAVADAFRDDDDYQNFWEKWLEALGGNFADEILPFNKLPIVSDFYDLAKQLLSVVGVDTYGNPPQSVFMQWYDSLVKGVEILYDKISGEDSNYTWYGGVYKLLQAASGITGLPMAAATREIITAWNSTVGALAPSLKVKSYEPSEQAQIRYAFEDGWLTEEEAIEQLISQGLVDNEDEAYWTIRGWEAGDGYSRYDTVYDAVRNGGDFSGAMRELTSHGYSEKDVISKVRSQIGTWYRDGEISRSQATAMLTRYADMDSEDITALVNKWSAKVVTGIAYDDIKQAFMDGDITASRAIEMYVRYGGYTHEEATKKVYPWRSEKEMGIPYDELYDAYEDGKLSATELVNAYVVYGQKDSYIELQNTYSTYAQSTGLSTEQFYSTYFVLYDIEGERDAEGNIIGGNGTQELRWAYINSLPLTAAQKDAFHLAFYKQSTLKNTPWH